MLIKDPTDTDIEVRSFPKRIYKLSEELANQIAAGEVVERPASILKELLENSLDAGSTQIDISIEKGGLGLIRVQDNGHGICKEDLELALSQHATSKILSFKDLEGVSSFGFRGEALASIAAVSRLSLSSCVDGQDSGYCIQKSGRHGNIQLSVCPPILGTILEVRDVFYNTPARRKFLRSEKTEGLSIEECFKRIALSHPAVGFTLRIDNKPPKRLVACKSFEAENRRVAELCGANFIKQSQFMEAQNNGLKIQGWISLPKQTRAQADLQYFYINGRSIRDKVVNYALRQAYQGYELSGRHPAYVLFFELDPESLDVNVHPTKHEVRFRELRSVTAFLIYSIRQALAKAVVQDATVLEGKEIAESIEGAESRERTGNTDGAENTEGAEGKSLHSAHSNRFNGTVSNQFKGRYLNLFQEPIQTFSAPITSEPIFCESIKARYCEPVPTRVLTVLNNEFVIAENPAGLLFIDIQAVIKAKTFNLLNQLLKEDLYDAKPRPSLQPRTLLMPLPVECKQNIKNSLFEDCDQDGNHDESQDWNTDCNQYGNSNVKSKNHLNQLGFFWTQIGPHSVLVRQVPFVMKTLGDDFVLFFQKLLSLEGPVQAMEWISEYVAKHEAANFNDEQLDEFIRNFEELMSEKEKNSSVATAQAFYRLVILEELRKLFHL